MPGEVLSVPAVALECCGNVSGVLCESLHAALTTVSCSMDLKLIKPCATNMCQLGKLFTHPMPDLFCDFPELSCVRDYI